MSAVLLISLLVSLTTIFKLNKLIHTSLMHIILQTGVNVKSSISLKRLWEMVLDMAETIQKFKNVEIETQKKLAIARLAKKVAHDIRSPISTLNMLSGRIENIEIREIQKAVVKQINFIANDLLKESISTESIETIEIAKEATPNESSNLYDYFESKDSILSTLRALESEYFLKRELIQRELRFEFDNELDLKNKTVNSEFTGVLTNSLNNFIQNSIEATSETGIITVSAFLVGGKIEISVADNGKGIPSKIIGRLGFEPLSFGKNLDGLHAHVSGSGIGLFSAKTDLLKFGAELKIYSIEGKGATVSIIL